MTIMIVALISGFASAQTPAMREELKIHDSVRAAVDARYGSHAALVEAVTCEENFPRLFERFSDWYLPSVSRAVQMNKLINEKIVDDFALKEPVCGADLKCNPKVETAKAYYRAFVDGGVSVFGPPNGVFKTADIMPRCEQLAEATKHGDFAMPGVGAVIDPYGQRIAPPK